MLKGVNKHSVDPSQRSMFKNAWTIPEGIIGATIVEAKVIDINLVLWTVDCVTQFDQKQYFNVQISTPYIHTNYGEGIYVMPDVGAKCHICIPSDGPPPYVLDFIVSQEIPPVAQETSYQKNYVTGDVTTSTTGYTVNDDSNVGASFHAGRTRAKPGDIYIKGRDGNFITLHKGGVLQIGATELAQRIYIPLQNLITDISQNYRHYNTGGSINWFLSMGESKTNPPSVYKETYRLLAADKYATIRITKGLLKDVVHESGISNSTANSFGMGAKANPIVLEVAITPDGFEAETGATTSSTDKATVLRYFFDKAGNALFRTEANIAIIAKKQLRVAISDNIDISTDKNFKLTAVETLDINGGKLTTIDATKIRLNGGSRAVAFVGSKVTCRLKLPWQGMGGGPAPVVIPPQHPVTGLPQEVEGEIISGNTTILV